MIALKAIGFENAVILDELIASAEGLQLAEKIRFIWEKSRSLNVNKETRPFLELKPSTEYPLEEIHEIRERFKSLGYQIHVL